MASAMISMENKEVLQEDWKKATIDSKRTYCLIKTKVRMLQKLSQNQGILQESVNQQEDNRRGMDGNLERITMEAELERKEESKGQMIKHTDVLTYHKTLLAKAQKEKDDLEVIVDKWNHSSKNLGKIINDHMTASDKFGLGYGDYRYSGNLSYENEISQSVFKGNNSDFENLPLHKRLAKTCEMQAVPPPMTGNYLPSGPDIEIDDSQYTYGPRKSQPSEPESQTTELDTCDSNTSTEPSELVSEPVVDESYNKRVVQPRENVKNQSTHSQKPKVNNKELRHGSTERGCFVCGSISHLIRDCDYHVKLAKQVELNKQNMSKGNGRGQRKPTWNNVQRVNKQNQFVPLAVQTRTGINPVNTAKASTERRVRPANVFNKTHSPSSRSFQKAQQYKEQFFKRAKCLYWLRPNQKIYIAKENPHRTLKNKGIIDSGCSRHMTGNKAYLADYQDINGGPVAFGGSRGYITGKGKIQTGKLDFEDVSFVKELQHFNLFSVSQMCDKKNKVLFTDTECLVLSPDFKLPDENQILLKVPRQNNMYSFNLENIVPLGGLACLIAKATTDESNLWHRRLGHVNFKNLNRLVKGNLVRGLPTKLFQNDHTCVACQKGKQHKASCKAKLVSSISQTLQLLHMDLFGPTSVRSINHKTYCLVITDDFSRFSWTFFLRTKDETSAILKDFIRQIENQLNQKVKILRCDNGTEFKNKEVIEFCGFKGIKREYCNARTPQQNGVAERKNRTLIEAARTMLADSFLPNTFWAEAVSTACYVLNRVLVTKPHNKTPYELLTGKGPNWLFDLDYLTDSMNYHYVSSENQANLHAGQQDSNQSSGTKDKVNEGDSEKEDESTQDCFELPIWHSYSSTNKSASKSDTMKGGSREEEQVFLDDLAKLQMQEKEASEEAEALRKNLQQETKNLVTQVKGYVLQLLYIFSTVSTTAKASGTNFVNTVSMPVSTASANEVVEFRNLETVVNQRRTNHKDFHLCLFACFLSQHEPKKISEALEDESWVDAMQEELLQFEIQKVWILVDLPYGKKAIGTKWVYRNKKDKRGVVVRNKARLVAQGHRQEEGIDYDDSFLDPKSPEKVYKVVKALYGLHQAPRAWHATLSTFLLKNGYRRGTIDKTLFLKKDKHDIILVQVYVDDIIFGSTKKTWCDEFEALMKSRFQMSSMGELTFFLGLQVKQKLDGIFISQDKYVAEILKKFDFASVKTASTPIETQMHLSKVEEANVGDDFIFIGVREIHIQVVAQFLGQETNYLAMQKSRPLWQLLSTEEEYVAAARCVVLGCFNWDDKSISYIGSREAIRMGHLWLKEVWFVPPRDMSMSCLTTKGMHTIGAMYASQSSWPRCIVSISEASIRTDLSFDDADGIDTLTNQAIFNAIQLMGYEGDLTVPFEQQPDPSLSPSPRPSPQPSPTPIVPDSIPEPTGENLGDHSSNDTSLLGNEDDMTLPNVYDLCISLCQQVTDQAKEIKILKAKIKKLKKQAKPVIKHFKAYLKTVSLQQRLSRKSSSKKQRMHKKNVSK
ncbi:putative ribonuclease H-like domain-containing protein [Tanacetum coccineum]